jgi:hypothetical protein
VLTGVWALLRAGWEREGPPSPLRGFGETGPQATLAEGGHVWVWAAHGLALSLLPWMHTRFAVLAATLGGLILIRLAHVPKAMAKAIAFLAPPAVSAVAWMFFFAVIYGTPDPSAPYGGRVDNSFAFLPNGLGGLLFDQGFGLLATAPVLVFALAGFWRVRRLALEWLVVAVPYLLSVTTFAMWWAGQSGPARFVIPLVLPLAIPAACAWQWLSSRGARAVMLGALVVTMWLSAVMAGAGGGRLGYHTRNEGGLTPAPWMAWATALVDLPSAAPAFVPLPVGGPVQARMAAARSGFAAAAIWIVCLGGAACAGAWWIDRRRLAGERSVAALTWTCAVGVMIASSIVWRVRAAPESPVAAQLDALRLLGSPHVVAFDLTARRHVPRETAWNMDIEIPIPRRAGRGGPRPLNRPIAVFPRVPAGSYRLQVRRGGAAARDGWVMAGVGNDQFAIVTQPIGAFDSGVRVDLPVDVRAINIRTDEDARDQLDAVVLRPLSMPRVDLASEVAQRAVRYGATVFYFLDDRAFPEPSGFWVGGGRDTRVAVQTDRPASSITLTIRNGAAPNRAWLESGRWRGDVGFGPGEERRVSVPLEAATGTALLHIHSDSGFRPADVDGRSTDTRYLGVFVRVE